MRDIDEIVLRIEYIVTEIKERLDEIEELVQELATGESNTDSTNSVMTENCSGARVSYNSLIRASLREHTEESNRATAIATPTARPSNQAIREEGRWRAQEWARELTIRKAAERGQGGGSGR
jgi:cell division septum initiation protein DivIVA